jgi:hypothetical protein
MLDSFRHRCRDRNYSCARGSFFFLTGWLRFIFGSEVVHVLCSFLDRTYRRKACFRGHCHGGVLFSGPHKATVFLTKVILVHFCRITMVVSILIRILVSYDFTILSQPIRILVSYDFTILSWPIDTYRDGILIWVVSYSYPDTYRGIFSIPVQKWYNTIPQLW